MVFKEHVDVEEGVAVLLVFQNQYRVSDSGMIQKCEFHVLLCIFVQIINGQPVSAAHSDIELVMPHD